VPHIVLSGLPGSGKSTLARRLASHWGIPSIDKDEFLDALFETRGIGDRAWRSALSRDADESFQQAALQSVAACLVSWWRHSKAAAASGTPTQWLASLAAPVIEVHCVCSVDVAVTRFLTRKRHVGHLDHTRSYDSLLEQFESLASLGPMRVGPVCEVATDASIDLESLDAWMRSYDIRPSATASGRSARAAARA